MHWTLCALIVGSFGCKYIHAQAQRIAPGVPPQHYQQPSQMPPPQHIPQQQYQQMPVQQHQVPMQQQQVPVQQIPMQQVPMQQQQVPMQQVPVQQMPVQHQPPVQQGHGHGHGHGQGQPQILNAANIAHEKEHIAEHADVPIDTSKMTDQELQFHYFKMHDADNNNKLDGCELIKSLIHWHEQGNTESGGTQGDKLFSDDELVQLIDPILNMDDTNNDGYIDYPEFIQAQQNAAASSRV
ncbi:PREDICTED: probable basic-leucine zipper transcription factor I [Dinoponera quadriceps]|uniref:Probable basic-leucine zipper transcription factor I n=1 Tax=Dinoponera quadriceps TaxID=609295 RepID=A0A6P3YBU2_DINQU|nr:PREDICTED: probable basic-leucine zipper transcription factor I [Dinoponera quadriceps]